MNTALQEKLDLVRSVLSEAERYEHACHVLMYDQETICPPDAMEEQGEVMAYLSNQAYRLRKDPAFIEAAEYLYEHRAELRSPLDRVMAEQLHREYEKTKNITPELQHEFSLIYNKAFVDWSEARAASDYAIFAPSLAAVADADKRMLALREEGDLQAAGAGDADRNTSRAGEDGSAPKTLYNHLLDDYERGMTSEVLDEAFGKCKERLLPLLEKIKSSSKTIRTDFLNCPVTDPQQADMARRLLTLMQFSFERGAFTTSEHPFTDGLGRNDTRVTTHYYPEQFASSMYSIIHEGGHALFDQNQPRENHDHFITNGKTLGMHESVSRFYENRIGRSESFVKLIYPTVCEVFPQAMEGVSARELYEALNVVKPSLIRTEADEFTYTFHVIIRYEIEKALFAGEISVEEIRGMWNRKYQEYLGIQPESDRTGVLQDVHWASGFGYFPTYAIGNFYNAMYYNRLKNEVDVDGTIARGDFGPVNRWMMENVFAKADQLSPKEWIRDITGRDFTPDDFLDYLEEKYSALYGL